MDLHSDVTASLTSSRLWYSTSKTEFYLTVNDQSLRDNKFLQALPTAIRIVTSTHHNLASDESQTRWCHKPLLIVGLPNCCSSINLSMIWNWWSERLTKKANHLLWKMRKWQRWNSNTSLQTFLTETSKNLKCEQTLYP